MGKTIIDISKAIEMRVTGATLRDIGKHFGTSPEAVRQAFLRAEKKKRQQKTIARLLVATSIAPSGEYRNPEEITKTINEWAVLVEAAKKGIALESEVAELRERINKLENLNNT